ncbi:MAG: phosphatidate cytidylyltransferase [Oscillospiraceae bacterium]|nr:phosphatidate cytidylyltransferase [Oscillospiraceae bacterium]
MVTRIITSAVGIVAAIVILFFSDTLVFNFAISAVSAIMVHEILDACKCLQYRLQTIVCLIFAAATPILVDVESMLVTYVFATLCIFCLFAGYIRIHKRLHFDKLCVMLATTLLISLSMTCIVSLRRLSDLHGVCYVVLALAGAWLGDSGAYFTGTFFGKRKLCPEISPKKTVEGAIGGVLTTPIIFVLYAFGYHKFYAFNGEYFDVYYPAIIIMGLLCGIFGIIGDLCASLLKRQYNVKDFGTIMPGHGGFMDRFDSVLFVAPFMALTLNSINLFSAELMVTI